MRGRLAEMCKKDRQGPDPMVVLRYVKNFVFILKGLRNLGKILSVKMTRLYMIFINLESGLDNEQ